MSKRTILGLLLIFSSFISQADTRQSLDLIKQKIESYVLNELSSQNNGDDIQISAEKIDSRLNLKSCEEDKLEVFNPYKTAIIHTTTMGIKCRDSDTHWTLYVPIKISLKKMVLVAKHPLAKGSLITENDIVETTIDTTLLKHGYFSDRNEVVGHVCKQEITEGHALTPANIKMAFLINKGDQVSIQAVNETLTVSMNGIALNDGSIGEMIRVQNLSSKKIVEGRVSANKQVRVTL